MAEKRQKEADVVLRKATTALTRAINNQMQEVQAEGVHDRAAEREQREYIQQH